MKKSLLSIVFLTGWILVLWQSQTRAAFAFQQMQAPLVIQGGLLVDGTGRSPMPDSVIVIADGKIQAVGMAGFVTVPRNATIINAAGKTVIPGLVDSHVHYRDSLGPLFLYWGVTSVGDMANPQGWILAERKATELGRITGPYIMAAGWMLNAPPKQGLLRGPGELAGVSTFLNGNAYQQYVSDEASIEAAIAEAQRAGVDAIKLYQRMNPALMKLAAEVAHRRGFRVFSHFTSANARQGLFLSTDEILGTGIDTHVHGFGLVKATVDKEAQGRISKGELSEAEYLMDTAKFPDLAQRMVDAKMSLNPTVGAEWEKFSKFREEFDRINTAFLAGLVGSALPEPMRRGYAATYKPYEGEHPEHMEEGYHKSLQFIKEFVDRGGKIIAGSDTGPGPRTPGITLHAEMQMLSEAGLKPMQIIQAATSWGMEAWGKLAEVGTIEAGKRADLVILNRNPLEDISATFDIDQVIQGGKRVDRQGLARVKDTLPRPTPMQGALPNYLIELPFITEISPDSLPQHLNGTTKITIRGQGFSPQSVVLLNDKLVPVQYRESTRLEVSLQGNWVNEMGTYPLAVVNPGSGGGISNPYYLVVVPD